MENPSLLDAAQQYRASSEYFTACAADRQMAAGHLGHRVGGTVSRLVCSAAPLRPSLVSRYRTVSINGGKC